MTSDFDLPFVRRRWRLSLEETAKKVAVQQLVTRHREEYVKLLDTQRRVFQLKGNRT